MRQDRRLNGWVAIASVIEIILGVVLLAVGVALAIVGFLYQDKLATITDLQFFINQKFFTQFNLKLEYLYLYLGIAVGAIGLIALVLGIIALAYAQKRKVVRRRVALLFFNIIPLAITGCAVAYLVLEFKALPTNIKYVLYGIIGAFGFVALCYLLGVIFGRSEQFMSNDNSKYAFSNSNLKHARVGVNNNVKSAQVQAQSAQIRPAQQGQAGYVPQQRPMGTARPTQHMNGQVNAQGQRPMPQGARPIQPQSRPQQPNGQPRPAQPMQRPMQAGARPIQPQPRPMPQGQRPVPQGARPNPNGVRPQVNQSQGARYCTKCGKMLGADEKFCNLCGLKVNE